MIVGIAGPTWLPGTAIRRLLPVPGMIQVPVPGTKYLGRALPYDHSHEVWYQVGPTGAGTR